MGDQCCKVRQICAQEGSPGKSDVQECMFALPGYTKAQLKEFQLSDPVLGSFNEFWGSQRKPANQERSSIRRPVLSLLKQWKYIQVMDGLFYDFL